jgi:hypothetical protein
MWMDRGTEMTIFLNFSNMPKKEPFLMTNNYTTQSFLSKLVRNISRPPQSAKHLAASCCYHEAEQCCG